MKRLLLFLISLSPFVQAYTCTTFFLNKNGQLIFGRNYDWVTETGMLNTNLRGVVKTSMDKGKTFQWVSKFGSISFNQYGKEFPNGGMNEKGLVVELMWLDESKFPEPDSRPALNVLQWIQYQLDNCSTIDEVIATDKIVRINLESPPQHYLIADAQGHAATVEFLNGKMVVHRDEALPVAVLANSTYQQSINAVQQAASKSSRQFSDNSLQRFSTACQMVKKFQQENIQQPAVEYAFDILKNVAQGNVTKWSIVYDISNRKIYFKTADYPNRKEVDFNRFDFSCAAMPKAFAMNQTAGGNISPQFVSYSNEVNKTKLKEAFRYSKSEINVDEETQNAMAAIAEKAICSH
jgi:choloylglycine hydrolase